MRANAIRVFTGGAPQRVFDLLLPAFERETGQRVDALVRIVSEIQERVIAGDHPDIIFLPEPLIAAIGDRVPLREEGCAPLARVGIGIVVPEGAEAPDLSDEAALCRALRAARAIVLADPRTPTGRHLASVFARLGLADELAGRLINKGAIHGGGELVSSGGADLGLFLVSEAQHIPGVRLAGMLPPTAQNYVVYGSAIPASCASVTAALSLIGFLKAPEHADTWRAAGFEALFAPENENEKHGRI
ncbi:MAG: putative periplasmic molybdate-binding protein [Hyphomicrobiales bacterium]|nr:putative periplasmic molybdate-binding protein [Hyphomicrobiales bacterium]